MAKLLTVMALLLFFAIGGVALFKGSKEKPSQRLQAASIPLEVELDAEILPAQPATEVVSSRPAESPIDAPRQEEQLPDADRIEELFRIVDPKLPIVETITYKSRVPWQKGRPAWLSDYASHYETSRHFIARSLNGKSDYFKQDVADGDRFNVLKKDKNFRFHIVIDASRCKMWLYYIDLDSNDRTLLKTYKVSLGRPDSSKSSGLLTPLGKYTLGNKVAIYKPSVLGYHKGQKVEMIRVFGTRWIPFEKEVGNCTAPAKGFGLHGVPWIQKSNSSLMEDLSSLGKYESDGCIRMSTEDIEEIFAIVITKPAVVELVKDFHQATFNAK